MPKATKDGVVEIGGTPFQIKAGEDYPEGGKWRESDQPTQEEGLSPPQDTEGSATAPLVKSTSTKATASG